MTAKQRFITGLIVAPLCAPLTMFVIISLSSAALRNLIAGGSPGYVDYLGSFEIVMASGAIMAYIFTALFGVPLYLFARRFGLITYWSTSIGGAGVAAVPFVLLGLTEGLEKMREHALIYLALAVCGFVVGSVFSLITEPQGRGWQKEAPSGPKE